MNANDAKPAKRASRSPKPNGHVARIDAYRERQVGEQANQL